MSYPIPAAALPAEFLLQHPLMDEIHIEFWSLYRTALIAPAAQLPAAFQALSTHLQDHFGQEETLMQASAFAAGAEHRADHQRVLGEVDYFVRRLGEGRAALARQWLQERLPDWFNTHLRTMDSALAAHLKAEPLLEPAS